MRDDAVQHRTVLIIFPLILQTIIAAQARFPFKRNRLRKRKPQETQALALASSQSWLPLLRPSIPIGWRTQALAFLAVFVYATQAIVFEWKPGFRRCPLEGSEPCPILMSTGPGPICKQNKKISTPVNTKLSCHEKNTTTFYIQHSVTCYNCFNHLV